MNEIVATLKDSPMMAHTNPSLFSQFILYDYGKALNQVASRGIKLGCMYKYGRWGIVFGKRKDDTNVAVVHALFKGFN